MPWSIETRGSKFCVIKDADGSNEGCHPTRAQAERQRRALYANEAAEMSIGELNSMVDEATLIILATHEDPLTDLYEQALLRIGRDGARQFLAEQNMESVVAAAWTPGYLATPELSEDEHDEADAIHQAAADHFALLVLATLGLAVISAELLVQLSAQAGDAISDFALDKLRRIVANSNAEGLTVEQTAERVRDEFTHLAPNEARLLARTQLTQIINEGAIRAAQALARTKTVYKTWNTVGDNRVRAAHATTGGQTVPVNQPFSVGGFLMMYPGDFSAPPHLVYNCRCSLSFTETLSVSASAPIVLEAPMSMLDQIKLTNTTNATATSNLAAAVTITVDEEHDHAEELTPVPWRGVLTLEKVATSDGRFFHDWSHRELPLPLNAQTTIAEGHMGAEVAGRIDRIWKQAASEVEGLEHLGEDAVAVMGEGELTTPFGVNEIAPMIRDQTLRGVSVDFSVEEMGLRDTETDELVSPDEIDNPLELMFGSRYRPEALRSTIAMATIVGFPAFAGASLTLLASANGQLGQLVTSAYGWQIPVEEDDWALIASAAPLEPPRAWFEDPLLAEPTPLQVTPDGRVFGHLAEWGKCHRGIRDACVIAPHSRSDYAHFHTGALTTDDGDIRVGRLTVGIPHAPITASKRSAEAHYDNTHAVVAFVRCGEDKHGPWLAGAVKSNATPEQVRDLKANPPSGDWREEEGALELIAALAVPVAGFPIAAISASGEEITALQMGWEQEGQIALVESDDGRTLSRADMRRIRVLTDAVVYDDTFQPYR
jgi:hypothetical protein